MNKNQIDKKQNNNYQQQVRNKGINHSITPFSSNLANNMSFGNPNNDVSGYVKRELFFKDSQGNIQKASEVQFFNSLKHIGEIQIERSTGNGKSRNRY